MILNAAHDVRTVVADCLKFVSSVCCDCSKYTQILTVSALIPQKQIKFDIFTIALSVFSLCVFSFLRPTLGGHQRRLNDFIDVALH